MAGFISRLFRGAGRANAVRTTYEYQVTLELEEVDKVFNDDVTTPQGKKARLQALGLFKRPINYDGSEAGNRSDECLAMVWRYFKEEIFGNAIMNVPLTDGQGETRLNQELPNYLVEGGALPAAGTFGKIRVPGDFPVFYRKGDPEYESGAEPEYTLAHANRYLVEQKFYDDNPALGKIPIKAHVERRVRGSGAAWAPVPANTRVYFQLLKPNSPPAFQPYSGNHTLVAGARSYVDQAIAPPLRNAYNVRASSQSANNPTGGSKNRGPKGYIRRFVRTYVPNIKKSDPQNGNTHWHLGGKYQMGEHNGSDDFKKVWGTRTAGPNTRENIFTTAIFPRFHNTYAATIATDLDSDTDRKKHKYAVYTETDANGDAGVIFCPSRIGGDRYKLQAYVYDNGRKYAATTGTMVVWRTIRISRDIVVQAPADAGQLPPDLTTSLSPFYASCTHASDNGNFCTACILKDGPVPDLHLPDYFTTELAKAYCELLLEEKAVNPVSATSAEIVHDIQNHLLPAIQNNDTINRLRFNEGELLILGDGGTRHYQNVQLQLRNVEPGSAVLVFGGDEIQENPAGQFPATPANNLTGGTIDHANGRVSLMFSAPLPNQQLVAIKYAALRQLDFSKLLYFPPNSPFLFNIRTPEDYNAQVYGTAFPQMPIDREHTDDMGPSDGIKHTFETDFFPTAQTSNPRSVDLLLNDQKIGLYSSGRTNLQEVGNQKFFSSFNPETGHVKIVGRKEHREQIGTGDGAKTNFVHQLVHTPLAPLGGLELAMQVFVANSSIAKLVYLDRLIGMSAAVPPKAPLVGTTNHREQIGTGDGTQTSFVYDLVNPPMEPLVNSDEAIEIFVANDLKGKLKANNQASGLKDALQGGSIAVDFTNGRLTVDFSTAPAVGEAIEVAYFDERTTGSIAVDYTAGTVTVDFATAPAAGEGIEVAYSERAPFPAGGNLVLKGLTMVKEVVNVVGAPERTRPYYPYTGAITDIVNNHLLIQLIRAISNNQGYMPGLICIRAPLRDTWNTIYKNLSLEGKGICNGFLMYMGDRTTGLRNPYHTIAFHELCHTLYFNHYRSGSAAGPRDDLHDMWDNCLMGYAASEEDLCGQCLANYMGMNVLDPRMLTQDATGFLEPDHAAKFGTAITA